MVAFRLFGAICSFTWLHVAILKWNVLRNESEYIFTHIPPGHRVNNHFIRVEFHSLDLENRKTELFLYDTECTNDEDCKHCKSWLLWWWRCLICPWDAGHIFMIFGRQMYRYMCIYIVLLSMCSLFYSNTSKICKYSNFLALWCFLSVIWFLNWARKHSNIVLKERYIPIRSRAIHEVAALSAMPNLHAECACAKVVFPGLMVFIFYGHQLCSPSSRF